MPPHFKDRNNANALKVLAEPPREIEQNDSLRASGMVPKMEMDPKEYARLERCVQAGIEKINAIFGMGGVSGETEENYRNFVMGAYWALSAPVEQGGFGWSKDKAQDALEHGNIRELVADITNIIWSNFEYGPIILTDSFSDQADGIRYMDCDVSAFVTSQLLLMFGIESSLVVVADEKRIKEQAGKIKTPGNGQESESLLGPLGGMFNHAIQQIGHNYFETTTGKAGVDSLFEYSSGKEFWNAYPAAYQKHIFRNSDQIMVEARELKAKGDFEAAFGKYLDVIEAYQSHGQDPNFPTDYKSPEFYEACDNIVGIGLTFGQRVLSNNDWEGAKYLAETAYKAAMAGGMLKIGEDGRIRSASWTVPAFPGLQISQIFMVLGMAYVRLGEWENAANAIEKLDSDGLLIVGGKEITRLSLENELVLGFRQGKLYLSEEKLKEIESHVLTDRLYRASPEGKIRILKEIVAERPDDAMAYAMLCEVYNRDVGNAKEALKCIEKAIGLEPQNMRYIALRSATYTFLGRYKEALADLELVAKNGSLLDLREIDGLLSGRRETEEGRQYLSRAFFYIAQKIANEPGHVPGEYLLGAGGWLVQAVGLDPNFAPAHRMLGETYLRVGKKEEAEEEFRKAKELEGKK